MATSRPDQAARILVTFQMLADLVVLGFGVKVMLGSGPDAAGVARVSPGRAAPDVVGSPADGEANPSS